MTNASIIKSAHGGTTLEFSDYVDGYYKVKLCGSDYNGTALVYADEAAHLGAFFRELATHWRGWEGKKEWGSLQGELGLAAAIDSTGHVSLSVRVHSGPYLYDWLLTATLLIEAGQLEQVAVLMEKFVSHDGAV